MCSWLQWSVCVQVWTQMQMMMTWQHLLLLEGRLGFFCCVSDVRKHFPLYTRPSLHWMRPSVVRRCVSDTVMPYGTMPRLRIEIENSWWVIMTMSSSSSSSSPFGMNNGISASERSFFFRQPSTEMLVQYFEGFLMVGVCCYYVHHSIVSYNGQLVCFLP